MSSVVNSLLYFLTQELSSDKMNEEKKESLQVAIDCIQRAYGVTYDPSSTHPNLVQIFDDLGIEQKTQEPEKAEQEKIKGNELLGKGQTDAAIQCYNRAIEFDSSNHIYYGNRAAAFIKLNKLDDALEDCYKALYINSEYSKAYARLGSIFMMKKDYFNANLNLSKACELEPQNESYKDTLEQCKKSSSEQDPTLPDAAAALPQGFGGIDFNALMNDPMVMNMAKNFMQTPQMQDLVSGLVNNPNAAAPGANPLESLFNAMGQPRSRQDQNEDPQ